MSYGQRHPHRKHRRLEQRSYRTRPRATKGPKRFAPTHREVRRKLAKAGRRAAQGSRRPTAARRQKRSLKRWRKKHFPQTPKARVHYIAYVD